jgi:hypothetical protein
MTANTSTSSSRRSTDRCHELYDTYEWGNFKGDPAKRQRAIRERHARKQQFVVRLARIGKLRAL